MSERSETARKSGYWTRFWKARFGWYGTWVDHGDGDRIPVGPSLDTWRPTEAWVRRVVTRRVERMKRGKAWRESAKEQQA